MAQVEKGYDKQRLTQLIKEWNSDHYDIFELSQPNQDLEFHGVVRFYYQDAVSNVVTKCMRVASSATTKEVLDVLIEKFRPDMRMLTQCQYALYEVHVNGEERKLNPEERPLLVQLNWGKDVREGRFLLKNESQVTAKATYNAEPDQPNFNRKLSKREKKEKKKKDKERQKNKENESGVAGELYKELPETSFTRSISNPEAVMRRRRQQKIEKKLKEIQGREGGQPAGGGTLKIYGETLKPDVPYKTLLLSATDVVSSIVKEAMEKYGIEKEDPSHFCLVQVIIPPDREYHGGNIGNERILEDDECPLAIAQSHHPSRGTLIFQLKRRPSDYRKPKHKKLRAVSHEDLRYPRESSAAQLDKFPLLVEVHPDGSENPKGKEHRLHLNMTEVGSERPMSNIGQFIQLHGLHPRHCVIAHTEGIITVTPNNREAETFVNNQRIYETSMLQHGMIVRFGKGHIYRFIDPNVEERMRIAQPALDSNMQRRSHSSGHSGHSSGKAQETNFDLDGHIETRTPQADRSREDLQKRSPEGQSYNSPPHEVPRPPQDHRQEDLLPASLDFRDEAEDDFLANIILEVQTGQVEFKLAPTYTLYMAVRNRLSPSYRPDIPPPEKAQRLVVLVKKAANMIQHSIQELQDNPAGLAFWMANASEILQFFKQDLDIFPFSQESQDELAAAVQLSFHHLVRCLQYDLQEVMPSFLDPDDSIEEDDSIIREDGTKVRYNRGKSTMIDVLDTLSSAMNLLRRCRVNAALTIQLFSQLFHFVNMWLFNTLVLEPQMALCTRVWGLRLKRRLGRIEAWAEKQGLELAADCHLCRIIQAAHLLQAPKSNADDIANISSTCFKLNSLQLKALLENYIPEPNEPPIPGSLIDRVVAIAENMADTLTTHPGGRFVRLEEDPDLQLPFLLPEDGYSCDTIQGIPNGLPEFIDPLAREGLCRLTFNQASKGSWTVYMTADIDHKQSEAPSPKYGGGGGYPNQAQNDSQNAAKEPEIITVSFNKVKGSMGLSIVAAVGDDQAEKGVYIKSVVPFGAAALDGQLQTGDQLLEVDGKSLRGLSQEAAAEKMTQTGQRVTLKVAKQGAIYHGLATLLSQPSPQMQRAGPKKPPGSHGKPKPHEEGPPPYNGIADNRMAPGPGMRQDKRDPRDPRFPQDPFIDPRQKSIAAQKAAHSKSSPNISGDIPNKDMRDHMRAPSASNLHDTRPPHYPDKPNQAYSPRDVDPRSKSTVNLNTETLGRNDPYMMRQAMSVNTLNQPGKYADAYPQRHDSRHDSHDYENQPQVDPRTGQPVSANPTSNKKPMHDVNHNMPPGPHFGNKPGLGFPGIERSPSNRSSNSSMRGDRPHSAYYAHGDRPDFIQQGRPKSEDISEDKVHEWQSRFVPPGPPIPHDVSFDSSMRSSYDGRDRSFENRDPSYVNTPPVQSSSQHPFSPPSSKPSLNDIPKAPDQQGHQNFYENTMARDQGPPSTYQQMKPLSPGATIQSKPFVPAKPSVAPKPSHPQRQDIPSNFPDQLQNNQQFYDPRMQNLPYPNASSPNTINVSMNNQPGLTHPQEPNIRNDFRHPGEITPLQREYAKKVQSPDFPLPPPPHENQNGMPTSPEGPPLPPPPSTHDYQLEQQLREEQERLMNEMHSRFPQLQPPDQMTHSIHGGTVPPNTHPQPPDTMPQQIPFSEPYKPPSQMGYGAPMVHKEQPDYSQRMPPGSPHYYNAQHPPPKPQHDPQFNLSVNQQNLQPFGGKGQPYDRNSVGSYASDQSKSKLQDTSNKWQPPSSQSNQPNYQNINFGDNSAQTQKQPPSSQAQNIYESYAPQDSLKSQPLPKSNNVSQEAQIRRLPPSQQGYQPTPLTIVKDGEKLTSPWERDEKDKAAKQQQINKLKLMEQEIANLESRQYLNPVEQSKLQKLRLEIEFQKRVQEVEARGDEDEDSDRDVRRRSVNREKLIEVIKEDLERCRKKIQEYDDRNMFDEYEMERDREERLQKKLALFEKEREETRQKFQMRQERVQQQHEEYLKKQKELREKQREDLEKTKMAQMKEAQKIRQREEEELEKKRERERKQRMEMQAARDAEEAALRAQVREEEEQYQKQLMLKRQQERIEQNRKITVSEERKRLETLQQENQNDSAYLNPPYANLPPSQSANNQIHQTVNNDYRQNHSNSAIQPGVNQFSQYPTGVSQYGGQQLPNYNQPIQSHSNTNGPPPPPERNSSFQFTNQHLRSAGNIPDYSHSNENYANNSDRVPNSLPIRNNAEIVPPKKSVSFTTQPAEVNTYVERTPLPSQASSVSSPTDGPQFGQSVNVNSQESSNEVFGNTPEHKVPNNVRYHTDTNTPGVIGAQEIYRDPRTRIQQKKAVQNSIGGKAGPDRMSFRDKMKYFAKQSGEDTPKDKPKASKTLRTIESQLTNGQ